jgi:hypothetical protein
MYFSAKASVYLYLLLMVYLTTLCHSPIILSLDYIASNERMKGEC